MIHLFRPVLVLLLAAAHSLAAPAQAREAAKSPTKPNVVIFFIDDLGWADLGCYGSTFYQTPNIDRLTASGVRFTQSYSANPVCSPTRAAMFTGKVPQRLGITQWLSQPTDKHLPARETTLAEAFQAAGYKTGYIGKWHLGDQDAHQPDQNGFDWVRATNRAGQPASYFFPYKRKSKRGSYWDVPDLDDGKTGDYLTTALTDHAITFITDNKNDPFFLFFAHYAVHTPIQAPEKLVTKYQAKREKLYGDSETPRIADRYNTVSRGRQDNFTYAAMIESLDTNIGRVLDTIESLGLTDSTLVLFTSDNGGHCHMKKNPGVTSNLPLRSGKGWTYEGGIRIPTVFLWKGHIKPGVCDTPAITMDMFPTLLDLTGQKLLPDQHLDGHSLKSAIEGDPDKTLVSRPLLWTYPHSHGSGHKPSHAIRRDNWKLIHFDADNTNELYNLAADPGEKHNLAAQHPGKVQKLHAELDEWIKNTTLRAGAL